MKMKTNKGSVLLILGVLVAVALVGGGAVYYKKSKSSGSSTSATDALKSVFNSSASMSPKEIFLKRNTDMYNAKSFDELATASQRYDDIPSMKEHAEDLRFKNANEEKKKAFFGFAQVFISPTEEYIKVDEVINGDTATVTASTKKGKTIIATFVKESGVWKLHSDEMTSTGSSK